MIEQQAGHVNWQEVNSLVRPGVVRLFTYQVFRAGPTACCISSGGSRALGTEKFYGGMLTHNGRGDNRVYQEISQIGEEIKRLAPALEGTKVMAEACILYSHENDWALVPAAPAQRQFQPARARPAFPQRAARPEHPGGFRAAARTICRATSWCSRPR